MASPKDFRPFSLAGVHKDALQVAGGRLGLDELRRKATLSDINVADIQGQTEARGGVEGLADYHKGERAYKDWIRLSKTSGDTPMLVKEFNEKVAPLNGLPPIKTLKATGKHKKYGFGNKIASWNEDTGKTTWKTVDVSGKSGGKGKMTTKDDYFKAISENSKKIVDAVGDPELITAIMSAPDGSPQFQQAMATIEKSKGPAVADMIRGTVGLKKTFEEKFKVSYDEYTGKKHKDLGQFDPYANQGGVGQPATQAGLGEGAPVPTTPAPTVPAIKPVTQQDRKGFTKKLEGLLEKNVMQGWKGTPEEALEILSRVPGVDKEELARLEEELVRLKGDPLIKTPGLLSEGSLPVRRNPNVGGGGLGLTSPFPGYESYRDKGAS